MHSIRQQIQNITTALQQENHLILQLIQATTHQSHIHSPLTPHLHHYQLPHQTIHSIEESSHHKSKLIEATNASRVSSSTVKQSSKRHPTSGSIKQSRLTQKSRSCKRKRPFSQQKKGSREQGVMVRLKKISQKQWGKMGEKVVLKKKSKIYHFPVKN